MEKEGVTKKIEWRNWAIMGLCAVIVALLSLRGCDGGGSGKVVGRNGDGKTVIINRDQSKFQLRWGNPELYDSIKSLSKRFADVEYALQLEYRKSHKGDTVYVMKSDDANGTPGNEPKTYRYGEDSDSVRYELSIGSTVEPDWYKLDFEVKDKITVVAVDNGDGVETIITTENGGEITNGDSYHGKRGKFINNVCFGPSIGVGYDPTKNNFGVTIGVSVTYDLFGKFKKR